MLLSLSFNGNTLHQALQYPEPKVDPSTQEQDSNLMTSLLEGISGL